MIDRKEVIMRLAYSLPCLTCLVRPVCFEVNLEGVGHVNNSDCDLWIVWMKRKMSSISEVTSESQYFLNSCILEILKEEKERSNEGRT